MFVPKAGMYLLNYMTEGCNLHSYYNENPNLTHFILSTLNYAFFTNINLV
jgi:hypothetical protein